MNGAETTPGLFTLYRKRNDVYLGLRPDQLDRDYLLVTQLSQGIGEAGLDGGASLRSNLVRFHRSGDRVELWVVNPHVTAPAGLPMAKTVAYSFGHSVVRSFPIATVKDTSEVLIEVSSLLLSDWADLEGRLQNLATQRRIGGSVSLDRERSSLQLVRVFPTNLEAEVRLTYAPSRNLGLETVADYRWISLGVHYSLLELPAVPMRPRLADDRVGYFVSALKDFSRDTADGFFVRYINRWRLERRDPSAPISEPIRPIVFYIDHTVPTEWHPYVRAGILEWNRAFEAAGFRNAIQVREAPKDSTWSAEDARYSTVRWTATHRSVYAIGPSNVDPRTGEILNADILISASWIQAWRGEAVRLAAPEAAVGAVFAQDSALRATDPASIGRLCSYEATLDAEGSLVRASLAEASIIAPGGAVPREYIGQALKQLVMHEVGHTLGLRHNFRGSAGITREQLANRSYTAAHGLGASVMDYAPPAISLDPQQQGEYYASTIGTYDRWVIQYGYAEFPPAPAGPGPGGPPSDVGPASRAGSSGTVESAADAGPADNAGSTADAGSASGTEPTASLTLDRGAGGVMPVADAGGGPNGTSTASVRRTSKTDRDARAWRPELEISALQAVASRATEWGHAYGTDEDAGFGRFGLDPTVTRYDQTDDPLGWARERVALVNRLFDSLDTRLVAPGQSYTRLRAAFADLLSARWYATLVATKYIGGAITTRHHRGDPGAQPAFVNVPAERQREALAFILQAGFSETAYTFRPELLSRLAPNRWTHWGSNPTAEPRIDFPLHDWARTQANALLGQLLDPVVLSRIRDAELRASPGEPVFTIPELFETLTAAIWAETEDPDDARNIGSVRRDLQRLHLDRMIRFVLHPPPRAPEDARAVARVVLTTLEERLDRVLAHSGERLDAYTRAHLADTRTRIQRALDAGMVEAVPGA